ncbi:GH-E family nuclease [Shewanella algae]|uniref:GH-E family nuclease n=1 Tax=Shewanella algae TaxID=38313 RepID=UPI0013DE684A|nr:GH-E family nuclease [Shewanella algae]MBO2597425.1 HNH/ENDO VII family nuclease [Shewanella algae]
MRIVHFRDAYQEDIPKIVKPDKAAKYIREYLSRRPGFYETVFGIDTFLRDSGITYFQGAHQIESIVERLSWRLDSGDFLLLGDWEDGFDTILFFGDISPFLSSTFKERVKRLPPRPQFGHGNYSKASEPIVEPNITPAPEAPAELKETGITKAINAMMGGAKQVINDYIDEQRASQAEWLADKGIIQAKDEATGQTLTPEELGERYRGNPTLPLADNELDGAEAVQSFVGYEAALLVLEAASNRKKLVTDFAEFKEEAGKVLTQINTKSPAISSVNRGPDGRFLPSDEPSPTLQRPSLRADTKSKIEAEARKDANGQFIDKEDNIIEDWHYGHKHGRENRRVLKAADEVGMTQAELNDFMNSHPDYYQIEDAKTNLSHVNEKPGSGELDKIIEHMEEFLENR